jgi:hypothetical protein
MQYVIIRGFFFCFKFASEETELVRFVLHCRYGCISSPDCIDGPIQTFVSMPAPHPSWSLNVVLGIFIKGPRLVWLEAMVGSPCISKLGNVLYNSKKGTIVALPQVNNSVWECNISVKWSFCVDSLICRFELKTLLMSYQHQVEFILWRTLSYTTSVQKLQMHIIC